MPEVVEQNESIPTSEEASNAVLQDDRRVDETVKALLQYALNGLSQDDELMCQLKSILDNANNQCSINHEHVSEDSPTEEKN